MISGKKPVVHEEVKEERGFLNPSASSIFTDKNSMVTMKSLFAENQTNKPELFGAHKL